MGANKVENLGMGARREAPKSFKIPPQKAITAAGQPPDTDQMSTVAHPGIPGLIPGRKLFLCCQLLVGF